MHIYKSSFPPVEPLTSVSLTPTLERSGICLLPHLITRTSLQDGIFQALFYTNSRLDTSSIALIDASASSCLDRIDPAD